MHDKESSRPRIALQIEKNREHGRALLKGISDYALMETNWRLELIEPERMGDLAYLRQFDGLIVRVMDEATACVLLKTHLPVVDTYGRVDTNPLSSIRIDDEALSEMAFAALAERHYESFAYCGFPGIRFSDARGNAFRAAAKRAGHEAFLYDGTPSISDTFFQNESIRVPDARSLTAWLKGLPKPIGLFCCNDLRALQVMNVCADIGMEVPQEIAVLGTDNDVLLCTFTNPSLSSVDTDAFSLGRKAGEMLSAELTSKKSKPVHCLWKPYRVVERESTVGFPFRTSWMPAAMRYIEEHISTGVTASEVTDFVGYSHPVVNRAFVEEIGHSIKAEILVQRQRMACKLLKGTDLTLAEIAGRCGYTTPQYFSSSFRQTFGMTPDEWRQKERFKNRNPKFKN